MAAKTKKREVGAQIGTFYNPGPKWTLGLPGKKGTMTKKKNKTGTRPTTALAVRKNTAVAPRKNSAARRPRSWQAAIMNPFQSIAGINPLDALAAGVALIVVEAGSGLIAGFFQLDQNGWAKIGVQVGGAIVVNKIAPRSVRTAATIGAAAVPAKSAFNKLTGDVVPNFIAGVGTRLMPQPQAPANGMAGLRGVSRYA